VTVAVLAVRPAHPPKRESRLLRSSIAWNLHGKRLLGGCMQSRIAAWPLCLAVAAFGCGEGGSVTESPTPAPPPTPPGTFVIVSTSPAFGGTVTGSQSDLQGT